MNRETETRPDLSTVFGRYTGKRGELIPILQEIEGQAGYLSRESMAQVARFLRIPESVVYGVATFYAQFHFIPQGRHRIKVCQGTACHVRGAGALLDAVQRKTGIGPGETSQDMKFSVERVACFGSCALAPVVVVDGKVHGKMTPQALEKLLEKIE